MTEVINRQRAWSPAPGARVRLRVGLDRPRVLDGEFGTVRYSWPFVSDEFHWLVALDETVTDGRRSYSTVLCSSRELEPVDARDQIVETNHGVDRSESPSSGESRASTSEKPRSARIPATVPAPVGRPATRAVPEIIAYRRSTAFVGRANELADFKENLALSLDDDRRRFIFDVFGPSGVGKTWLLRRYADEFRRAGGIVVWTDDSEEDVVGVMEQIVGQLAAQGWSFGPFEDELRRYRQYWRGQQPREADRSPAAGVSCREARAANEFVPVDLCRGDDLESSATDRPNLAVLGPRFVGIADSGPLQQAARVLTPLFLSALQTVAADRPIGLFFDGYERTGSFLDSWLHCILNGQYGDLPGTTMIAIAGQAPLDSIRWSCFESIIARVRLGPLADDEVRGLLLHHWILDDRVVETAKQVSGRLPVLVATMAVRVSDHQERLVDPSRSALDCFLASLGDPARRAVALTAAVPRRLDVDVLHRLIDDSNAIALIDWLRKMPFVEQRGSSWTYRRVVRDVLLRYVRDTTPDRWILLHRRLAEYYEGLGADLEHEPASPLRDATRQSYAVEALYHRLSQDAPGFRAQAFNGFVDRFGGDQTLARRWAQVIREAGEDAADEVTQLWGERFLQCIEAFLHRRYESAASTFDALLATGCLDAEGRRRALAWYARLLSVAAKLEQALAAYDDLVNLASDDVSVWLEKGLTLSRLGRHREALDCFGQALTVDPNNPVALARRRATYRLLEDVDDSAAGGPSSDLLSGGDPRAAAATLDAAVLDQDPART